MMKRKSSINLLRFRGRESSNSISLNREIKYHNLPDYQSLPRMKLAGRQNKIKATNVNKEETQ